MKNLIKNLSIITFSLILISFLFIYKASAESQFPAGPGGYCDNSGNNTCDTNQSLVCVFTEQTASGLWKGNCLVAGPTATPAPAPTATPSTINEADCNLSSNVGKACINNFGGPGICDGQGTCAPSILGPSAPTPIPTTPPTPIPAQEVNASSNLVWRQIPVCTIPTEAPVPTSAPAPTSSPTLTTTVTPNKPCSSYSQGDPGYTYTCSNQNLSPSCENRSSVPGFDASACTNAVCWRCPAPSSTPSPTRTAVVTPPTTIPTPKPCSGPGYQCRTDQPSGCQLAPTGIFDCSLPGSNMITNWGGEKCVICAVPTQAPAVGPGGGYSGGSGSSGSNATAPAPSANSVVLNFGGVLLPGMVANAIPVTITMFNGSVSDTLITAPERFSLQRPTGSNDIFTGSSLSLDLPSRITRQTTGNFYVNVGVKSYKKETVAIGQEDSTQPGTGHRLLSSSVQVPNITLLPGDINNDGEIGLVDYQILRACFGVKESSPECAVQKQNGQLVPDINRDSRVDGIDINLLWRGANNVATN